jgi:hypothetical protein
MSRLVYKMSFKVWLDKQHPAHSEYDFDSIGEYNYWKKQLFEAYCAGVEFERTAREAGM